MYDVMLPTDTLLISVNGGTLIEIIFWQEGSPFFGGGGKDVTNLAPFKDHQCNIIVK